MDPEAGTTARIDHLEEVAADLETLDDEAAIYERAVTAADRLVEFDACGAYAVEEGEFVPKAATARELHFEADPLDADAGIAGRTVRTGDTQVVTDVADGDGAHASRNEYRAVLSVPLAEDGVFQVLSTTPAAFDETDRELVELLVDHVEHAIQRVSYEAAVERERDRFVALFENVPDAAVQYSLDGGDPVIERVNSAFVRVFGYEPESVVGASTLSLLVPDDRRDEARELYDTVRAGDRIDREVRRQTADGSRPFLLRSVPVPGDDERTGYFIYTDIAEMKERQRRLERKNERLDAFASVVSHDLRNPLSVARGYAELGRDAADPDYYEEVLEELGRMDEMIDELLTLARSGDVVGDADAVDLASVVDDAWSHVDTTGARLQNETGLTTEADRDRLVELLENLFRNSVEHGDADDSGGEATVTVTVGDLEGDRGFFVADDGSGIPDDEKDQVFDRGFSTAADGTGFGLAIVAEIVEAHGWTIDVTDADGGGARFEVTTETADRVDPGADP